jgi:hypothetical protein
MGVKSQRVCQNGIKNTHKPLGISQSVTQAARDGGFKISPWQRFPLKISILPSDEL